MSKRKKADLFLHAGVPTSAFISDFKTIKRKYKSALKLICLYDKKNKLSKTQENLISETDYHVVVNMDSQKSIINSLKKYADDLIAVTCRAEKSIPSFQKIIPNVPYLKTPTVKSLQWATEKIEMRKQLKYHYPETTPHFMIVHDDTKESIEKITKDVGFPLVIKPSGLAQSTLVNIVYHKEELEKELKKVFRKINSIWKADTGRGEPTVLVEHFMEGKMYSFDAFVNNKGKVRICPAVSIKTGKEIGFDDFFGYQQMTPTDLNKESVYEGEKVVKKAIYALGLRNTSAHVELMKTEQGWKVIELGPRLGGFRSDLYKLSFGIDIGLNDAQIRTYNGKIRIPKKIRGYTAAFKFYARKEGYITSVNGIIKIQELKSFHSIAINKQVGDRAIYAKNGGKSVFNIILFNKNRSELLADIRRMEQTVKIETSKTNPSNKGK